MRSTKTARIVESGKLRVGFVRISYDFRMRARLSRSNAHGRRACRLPTEAHGRQPRWHRNDHRRRLQIGRHPIAYTDNTDSSYSGAAFVGLQKQSTPTKWAPGRARAMGSRFQPLAQPSSRTRQFSRQGSEGGQAVEMRVHVGAVEVGHLIVAVNHGRQHSKDAAGPPKSPSPPSARAKTRPS